MMKKVVFSAWVAAAFMGGAFAAQVVAIIRCRENGYFGGEYLILPLLILVYFLGCSSARAAKAAVRCFRDFEDGYREGLKAGYRKND